MSTASSSIRSARLGLRATREQEMVLRRAAEVAHKSLTDFILDSACLAAEQTLLDQRLFMVPSGQYQALMDLLDESEKHMGVNEMVLKIAQRQPRTVSETKTPKFNSITLFYLPEQTGRWHYVSHVNPGVKASRIAYTGWAMK